MISDINISQKEADHLIKIEKNVSTDKVFVFPTQINFGKIDIPLLSVDEREEFILTIARKQLVLEKQNHLLRVRKSIVLLRLDVNGPHIRIQMGKLFQILICIFIKKVMVINGLMTYL